MLMVKGLTATKVNKSAAFTQILERKYLVVNVAFYLEPIPVNVKLVGRLMWKCVESVYILRGNDAMFQIINEGTDHINGNSGDENFSLLPQLIRSNMGTKLQ